MGTLGTWVVLCPRQCGVRYHISNYLSELTRENQILANACLSLEKLYLTQSRA